MNPPNQGKELVRESEWIRIYRVGPERYFVESKFAKDGLQIAAASIRERWKSFTLEEQVDFAQAFIAKPTMSMQDQQILEFLMEEGAEHTWDTISFRLPEYQDRDRAFSFILERVASGKGRAANYYRALERIGDTRAVSLLQQRFEQYRTALSPLRERTLRELGDYLACCRALWKLDGSQEYEIALREMMEHPAELVRSRARLELREPKP